MPGHRLVEEGQPSIRPDDRKPVPEAGGRREEPRLALLELRLVASARREGVGDEIELLAPRRRQSGWRGRLPRGPVADIAGELEARQDIGPVQEVENAGDRGRKTGQDD